MPSLQLYAGVLTFETIPPAFKSGQSLRPKIFPLVPTLVFRSMMKNFRKLLVTDLKNRTAIRIILWNQKMTIKAMNFILFPAEYL